MTAVNTQCRLAARPVGLPQPSDWTFTEELVPSPADGELLVRVEYLSIDPAMRTWMNAGRSYVPPVEIGDVMRAAGIARVIESHHADFAAGSVGSVAGRSHESRVAGRSVSQAARRSVADWSRSSGSTPPSTTRPAICARS